MFASIGLSIFLLSSSAFGIISVFSGPDFSLLKKSVEITVKKADGKKSVRRVGPKAAGWVPIQSISNHLLMAVIASEDASFYSHKGVDYHELKESVKKDLKEKKWARGASTLTQQVIKNVFLSPEKSLVRKAKEFLWAPKLEKVLSKSEILCFYVNMVEWGPGIYGIGEAASHYFGVEPISLSARQSAFLAMLLPSPVKYHAYFAKKQLTRWASQRVNQILNVMFKMGFIDQPTYQAALTESFWGEKFESTPSVAVEPVPSEDQEIDSFSKGIEEKMPQAPIELNASPPASPSNEEPTENSP